MGVVGLRVRDMPRQQQKAVFAKMTDDGYLATLQGAESYQRRRNYLIKRNDLSETYEDKIFNAFNNPKLTHRQRMAKVAQLKKEAAKKLKKYQLEESGSITKEIREENWRRFKKEFDIKEVPVKKVKVNDKLVTVPPEKSIITVGKERVVLPELSQKEEQERIKFEAILKTTRTYNIYRQQGFSHNEAIGKIVTTMQEKKPLKKGEKYFSLKNLPKNLREKKVVILNTSKNSRAISFERGNIARAEKEVIARKVAIKGGAISPQAVATQVVKTGGKSSNRKAVAKEHKAQIKKAGLTDKNLTWKQVKKIQPNANPHADYDLDGVKNKGDCRPMDKKKQDLTSKLIKATEKTIAAYQKSRTSEARIKKAKAKLASLKKKETAEALEAKAKAAEKEYKATHPKRFGIF